MTIFTYNGINKTSKFCFWKCIWIFFCGNLYSQNIIRILRKYCYKVLKNKKAKSDNHVLMQQHKVQHTTQTQQIVKCCKTTHIFQKISDKPKMSRNFANILSTILTKTKSQWIDAFFKSINRSHTQICTCCLNTA